MPNDKLPSPDAVVVKRVLQAPRGGRVRRDFAETLRETGVGRLLPMARGGQLFTQLREMNIGLSRPPRSFYSEDAEHLVHEAVYKEAKAFMDFKLARWDPERGLSLENFFVRGCLLRFVNLYRKYLKEEGYDARNEVTVTTLSDDDLTYLLEARTEWGGGRPAPSPETVAENGDLLRRAVPSGTDSTNREILFERAVMELPWKEIAEAHGLSVEAADARYRRLQRRDGDEAQ
ncbi:hypothetical protein [Actinomycetospora sp. CA-084318]|uniref:hypothetical protein n=1 Tax=Actinomycetospora sp. CA-084318 TaxID=3239892 RepID=UPI003D9595C6